MVTEGGGRGDVCAGLRTHIQGLAFQSLLTVYRWCKVHLKSVKSCSRLPLAPTPCSNHPAPQPWLLLICHLNIAITPRCSKSNVCKSSPYVILPLLMQPE